MSRHLARGPWETTAPSMPRGPACRDRAAPPAALALPAARDRPAPAAGRPHPTPVGHPEAAEEQTRRAGSAKVGS